jgi:N-hydroxyarylamine O-acetyltransferase
MSSEIAHSNLIAGNREANSSFDLEKYFERIGYAGERHPTLDVLKALHQLHAQAIPFENLNPFLRIPVVLDIDSIYSKLVLKNRGGYCFEHNLLFSHVLKSIGFTVKGLAARVLWNIKEEIVTARGHMLLQVDVVTDTFIADVGFGGLTLTAPLEFKTDLDQQTPHETFRIVKKSDDFLLEAQVGGVWKRLYSFTMQENFPIDYEVTNWYLSTHLQSHFLHNILAALPFENGRYALRNREFTIYNLDGTVQRQEITNISALKDILETRFGIELPVSEELDFRLSQVMNTTSK